jgi:hypothetical protein
MTKKSRFFSCISNINGGCFYLLQDFNFEGIRVGPGPFDFAQDPASSQPIQKRDGYGERGLLRPTVVSFE